MKIKLILSTILLVSCQSFFAQEGTNPKPATDSVYVGTQDLSKDVNPEKVQQDAQKKIEQAQKDKEKAEKATERAEKEKDRAEKDKERAKIYLSSIDTLALLKPNSEESIINLREKSRVLSAITIKAQIQQGNQGVH